MGIRPGEKIHEDMITSSDSINTIDLGKYYAIFDDKRLRARYDESRISICLCLPASLTIQEATLTFLLLGKFEA